jgi:alkylation response protein AidB-like acyl-CoA dehydrogenase
VRQIQWRFADRFELQMLVQSTRAVARGPVARLVALGERNNHDWTERKNELLAAYDSSGITAVFMDPEHGGLFAGPKNLALALVALSSHGSMAVPLPEASQDVLRLHRFTNAALPNKFSTT